MAKDRLAYNAYHLDYKMKRYLRIKTEFTALLGGVCKKCGSDKDLEFDHIDPATKEFTLTEKTAWMSKKRLLVELAKCQLLCAVCHTAKTIVDLGHLDARLVHGTLSSYKYCKCVLCKKAKSDTNKKHAEERIKNGWVKKNGRWVSP